ncbi:MAG TPA: 4Fe-4S binding protein [Cyclobacteriaceae bacterium]|jgi:formate hydrogenlyase subunit 6/NADH:ubiquinone oxidoreductase subunit I|nr:4Fe-4S binding protein [Cyclobacteriaceae bacterium]
MATENTYWGNISSSTRSLLQGLKITFSHIIRSRHSRKPLAITDNHYFDHTEGINTIQYPYEMQPVPDNGRYRLHNEIDDCIVCDKCAKVCPVDCIIIEPIKAVEEIGKTSDGTPKRIYAATFDIDMGKCCFCGLCTTVCPTECLTMTKVYDFSTYDIREHNFVFGEMTEAEIAEKKKALEDHQKSKVAAQPVTEAPEKKESTETPKPGKPVFRPKIKPAGPPPSTT